MENIFNSIRKTGIVPVVVIEDAKDAAPLANALCKGGLPCAEITFRTDAAEEAIGIIKKQYPDMLIGAGTVLTPDQVDRAVAAGAGFIVSPGLNPKTVEYCQSKGVPIIPGIQTPSEIELALSLGLETLKFFPAEPAGGLEMIKAIAAPYTGVTFMPTGGINIGNVRQYLAYERIIACGGSWMVKKDLISSGDFDTIREMTAVAAEIVKEVRGA